jgi:hypothetical protein
MPRRKYAEDSFYNHCRSKTPEEGREKWVAEERKQSEADRLSVERHQPVVTRVEDDGEGLVVEFTRANGEHVRAGYVMSTWHRPPADVPPSGQRRLGRGYTQGPREKIEAEILKAYCCAHAHHAQLLCQLLLMLLVPPTACRCRPFRCYSHAQIGLDHYSFAFLKGRRSACRVPMAFLSTLLSSLIR